MSEFNEPECLEEVVGLEAPKVKAKAPKKPKAPKVEFEAGANGRPAPLDTTFDEEELLEECTPVKKGKGRPKKIVEPVAQDDQDASPPKPKRVQTDAQRENFKKALAKRQENIALRKAAKEAEQEAKVAVVEEKKKEVERKVLKKAVVLKKREILEQTALDEISDTDDIPDEIVQKIVKKQRAKAQPKPKSKPVASEPVAQNKYNFV